MDENEKIKHLQRDIEILTDRIKKRDYYLDKILEHVAEGRKRDHSCRYCDRVHFQLALFNSGRFF